MQGNERRSGRRRRRRRPRPPQAGKFWRFGGPKLIWASSALSCVLLLRPSWPRLQSGHRRHPHLVLAFAMCRLHAPRLTWIGALSAVGRRAAAQLDRDPDRLEAGTRELEADPELLAGQDAIAPLLAGGQCGTCATSRSGAPYVYLCLTVLQVYNPYKGMSRAGEVGRLFVRLEANHSA